MTSNNFLQNLFSDILARIEEYKKSMPKYIFKSLEITIQLGSPVILTTPWLMIDGILSYLYAEEILEELWKKIPLRQELKFSDHLPLPLKKTTKNNIEYYHGSVSRFEHDKINSHTIRRAFSKEALDNSKKIKPKYDNVRGDFKSCQLTMITNNSNRCKFWCEGDKDEISRILKNLTALGKKRGSGCGQIISIEITEIQKDYSIFHPTYGLNRPIPIECIEENGNLEKANLSYKAPYWSSSNFTACYVPEGF